MSTETPSDSTTKTAPVCGRTCSHRYTIDIRNDDERTAALSEKHTKRVRKFKVEDHGIIHLTLIDLDDGSTHDYLDAIDSGESELTLTVTNGDGAVLYQRFYTGVIFKNSTLIFDVEENSYAYHQITLTFEAVKACLLDA